MSDTNGTAAVEEIEGKRRMPDNLRRYLLKVQGGKLYLPAAYRMVWFRDECPDWGIDTAIIEGGQEAGFATVRAFVTNEDGRVIATGHKTETRQDFPAGWVEKAETGAISRALVNVGFGSQFGMDNDEVSGPSSGEHHEPGTRTNGAAAGKSYPWAGPGQCPHCHAPEGKNHGKPCTDGTPAASPQPTASPQPAAPAQVAAKGKVEKAVTKPADASGGTLGEIKTAFKTQALQRGYGAHVLNSRMVQAWCADWGGDVGATDMGQWSAEDWTYLMGVMPIKPPPPEDDGEDPFAGDLSQPKEQQEVFA